MIRSALFLSPHLDDVAFSCGGTVIRLVEEGWRVRLCTVFTASVPEPKGFALACQLDKGLNADVDYMALRRAEDHDFARLAGVVDPLHLPYREAPHRGYENAADLFGGIHDGDEIRRELADRFTELATGAEIIFGPQGLGNHVDHLQVIRALEAADLIARTVWYTDIPYAIRYPEARPSGLLPGGLREQSCAIDLQRKIACCSAYRTQVPFQFGSDEGMAAQLTRFHVRERGYGETFLADTEILASSLAN